MHKSSRSRRKDAEIEVLEAIAEKLKEIERMKKIPKEKESSPLKTMHLIEEIKVPTLKVLKEKSD